MGFLGTRGTAAFAFGGEDATFAGDVCIGIAALVSLVIGAGGLELVVCVAWLAGVVQAASTHVGTVVGGR